MATAFYKLLRHGRLKVSVDGHEKEVKVKLLVAADFQFFKAAMKMSKYTSAVWCECGTDNLFKRPTSEVESWEQVLEFYDSIGCRLKDLQTICELNHYSFEVLNGRPHSKSLVADVVGNRELRGNGAQRWRLMRTWTAVNSKLPTSNTQACRSIADTSL